jgi:hypothetical protein
MRRFAPKPFQISEGATSFNRPLPLSLFPLIVRFVPSHAFLSVSLVNMKCYVESCLHVFSKKGSVYSTKTNVEPMRT